MVRSHEPSRAVAVPQWSLSTAVGRGARREMLTLRSISATYTLPR